MGVRPVNGLELCAGIGALGLGVARAIPGYRTVVASEIEAYAVAVLAARQEDGSLPPFPIWDDLTTFDGRPWRGVVDIVVAGFPCQDISLAGKGDGINGQRSGLWFDVLRIIREVGPAYVFLENVAAITLRGLDVVAAGLAESGFDAEWGCLRASDVGAPHRRDRWWCLAWDREQLANATGEGLRLHRPIGVSKDGRTASGALGACRKGVDGQLADADPAGLHVNGQSNGRQIGPGLEAPRRGHADGCDPDVADAARLQRPGQGRGLRDGRGVREVLQAVGDAGCTGLSVAEQYRESGAAQRESHPVAAVGESSRPSIWPGFPPGPDDRDGWRVFLARYPDLAPAIESPVRGRADGAAPRVDQLRALGNAVVPQQAEAALRLLWHRAFGSRP
jgi:DNA (cytosine-5)-methyltransferase 1